MEKNLEHLPEQIKNMDMCALSDWNKYFQYPSVPVFRQMIFHSQYNNKYDGIHKTVRRIGGRVFIKISAFFEWLDRQNGEVA